eukprot:Tbor_TRINITY_DN2377_c0_g1::TRINITY_DN2377_c0_g1_i2::g.90::m.90
MHSNINIYEKGEEVHRNRDESLKSLTHLHTKYMTSSSNRYSYQTDARDNRISVREAQELLQKREMRLLESIDIFAKSTAQQMDYLEKREAELDKREQLIKEKEEQLARNKRALISEAEKIDHLLKSLIQKQERETEVVVAQALLKQRDISHNPQMPIKRAHPNNDTTTDVIPDGQYNLQSRRSQSSEAHTQSSSKHKEGILSPSDPRATKESYVEELTSSDTISEKEGKDYNSQEEQTRSGHVENTCTNTQKNKRKKQGIQGRSDFVPLDPNEPVMDFFIYGPTADFERHACQQAGASPSNHESCEFEGNTREYGNFLNSNSGEDKKDEELDEAINYLIEGGFLSESELMEMMSSGTGGPEAIINMARDTGMQYTIRTTEAEEYLTRGDGSDSENIKDISESEHNDCYRPKTATRVHGYTTVCLGGLGQEDDQTSESFEVEEEISDNESENVEDEEFEKED